jgi:hypothetical protein
VRRLLSTRVTFPQGEPELANETAIAECDSGASMNTRFQFSRLEMALLITNVLVFGGCVILLLLGRVNGPLILLCVGTLGLLVSKLEKARRREQHPEPAKEHKDP